MLERDFLGFINDKCLFKPTDCVLLAVSGGLDSVVMAEVFHRTGQPFAIAHVNFGLRGTESDADAAFVQNKAKQYGVPFHSIRVETALVAAQRGISIQMAARELRYDWFAQLLRDHSYACVATAHHQNDVLETMLLNLIRGTGLAGLHGIAARQGDVVRPLLFATRDDLSAYADENGLLFREDSSNADDKYARNRLRHQVVPVFSALNPGLWQTLPRTIERLRAAEALMQAELARSWQETAEQEGEQIRLPIHKLRALPEQVFQLAAWLKPFGFTGNQVEQITMSLEREVGQVFLSASHRLVHERIALLLEPLPTQIDYEIVINDWANTVIEVGDQFTLRIEQLAKPDDFRPSADATIACLDADRLTFPLTIRPWRLGDRVRPLGLQGHKLVSDLLNDLKLTRSEREQTAVLLSGAQIAWVIGRRIAHPFRITEQTKRMARLSWQSK
ncbi:tRNA lysidine(34) synthetase TilS [Spirosoma soli]|uniref:tRNA(Ile)-lysidine synthase n=1 Tax=Spirosoma soli TaxID=1770529 RepID=A0ABW5M7R3_9BACT